jgi:hypothetical protein
MNNPGDPYSLLSYLNREQYGDRPLVKGPHFMAKRLEGPKGVIETGSVYRPVFDKKLNKFQYKVVDKKVEVVYRDEDYMLFPRLGHMEATRRATSPRNHTSRRCARIC